MRLSRKINVFLLIWGAVFIIFALLILFLPALAGKPLCLTFFMINGSFIVLLLSWLKSAKIFMQETGLILSKSKDLIWAMDSRLNLTVVCGNLEQITGKNAVTLLNKPLASILTEDAKTQFNARIRENLPFSMECLIGNGKNPTRPVEIIAEPIHGPGQDTFYGIIRDISAQKKMLALEKEVNRSKKLKTLGKLAGSVAHDLNNILAGIATYPEILLLDDALAPKIREGLTVIKDSGQNASAVVSDLLTISKGVREDCQVLNLNTLIERFMAGPEFKKIKSGYKNIDVETSLEPELLTISGSYIHVEKTIMYLLINAFEETAATADSGNGTILLSTANYYLAGKKDEHAKQHPASDEYVKLEVRDTGKMIPEADLKQIFDPFFTKKKRNRSGTGLGLTVVKHTVVNHRGKISVASDENGTTFTLLFPILRSELPMTGRPASLEEIKGHGETLLVVDDLASQRKIAETILKYLGYKVYSVADGMRALDFVLQTPVDLLILDMVMAPSISGLKTYRRIKKIRPDQKAILASGHSESEDVLKAQSIGAGAFIKKPYTILDMGIAVKEELEK
jgi:PAS domain S-box-containing protein